MNGAALDLIERICGRFQNLGPWIADAGAVTEIGLVAPHRAFRRGTTSDSPNVFEAVKDATRMLCELKVQCNVLSTEMAWEGMKLIVLPDEVGMTAGMIAKIRSHLGRGGGVISCAWSGLDDDRRDFVLDDWGLSCEGPSPHDPAYFTALPPMAEGLPEMPHNFYGPGISARARDGTEILARVVAVVLTDTGMVSTDLSISPRIGRPSTPR